MKIRIPLILSITLAGISAVRSHAASATPHVSVCSVGTKCHIPVDSMDYIDSTILLRRTGTLEQKRFRLRRLAFKGAFSIAVTGLKAGTYTARIGNTHGSFHQLRLNGRVGKFTFYREDLQLSPTTFTSTGPRQEVEVTATVSSHHRCEVLGLAQDCTPPPV